jgi:hypothetical protein
MNTDLLKHETWYLYTERNGQLKLNEIKKKAKLNMRLNHQGKLINKQLRK